MSYRTRVVFIYHRFYPGWFPSLGEDSWYLSGHTGLIAQYLNKFTKEFDIENWRPDATVTRYMERTVDGILCRVFPSQNLPYFGDISIPLLQQMMRTVNTSERVIIHYGGLRSFQFAYTLLKFSSTARIVGNHFGDILGSMQSDAHSIPRKWLEKWLFKRAHYYLCGGQTIMDCLASLGVKREAMSIPEIGIDPDLFCPLDSHEMRHRLDLPTDKPLILYIGRADQSKGLPKLLDAMPEISQRSGAQLICVGCEDTQPLISRLRQMEIRYWPHVPHELLPVFHNACDILVDRPGGSTQNLHPTVSTNVRESLACGTPVVSSTLKEFPSYLKYGDRIGDVGGDDLADIVVRILRDGKETRSHWCREVVLPYSWKEWLLNLVNVYGQ